jgi:hypothetical protein
VLVWAHLLTLVECEPLSILDDLPSLLLRVQVESHFRTNIGLSNYWLSMYKLSTIYIWVDNGFIGGLVPKRGSPYVHVGPSKRCCQLLGDCDACRLVIAAPNDALA